MHGATLRPEAASDGGVGGPTAGDGSRCQGHVDRHAVHGLPRKLFAGLQQSGGIGLTALGFPVLVPGLARSQGKKGLITGGQGQALPTFSGPLQQRHSTGVVGRPGGVYSQD